jgi:hypothetical protein
VNDAALIARFEDCTLPGAEFGHREHVRVAWIYLREASFEAAAFRFCAKLREFAASLGKADRYHETITWAYLAIVNERMQVEGGHPDFESFARANPDLFDDRMGAIAAFYDRETLKSDLARRAFLLPRPALLDGRARGGGARSPKSSP